MELCNQITNIRWIIEKVREFQKNIYFCFIGASLVAQRLKCLPGMQETQVRSLGREDPLEKEMATHSCTLAWRIPWREEPGGLQSMGLQRVGHDWANSLHFTSALSTMPKPLTVWIITNCGKFLKRWEWQNTWPASWETYMQVKKQQLELDMEQETVSK